MTTMNSCCRLLLLLFLVVAPRNTKGFITGIPSTGQIVHSYQQQHYFSGTRRSSTENKNNNEVSSSEAAVAAAAASTTDDSRSSSSSNNNNNNNNNNSLDPYSEAARALIVDDLGLSDQMYKQLVQLSELVTEWNEKINLVSRKDCNPSTVFGRHILPCVAVVAATTATAAAAATATAASETVEDDKDNNSKNPLSTAKTAIDVGTGGGFPGLPLAILYPEIDFVLLDSVGKKLTAVQAMADALHLKNVQVHHGRAEDYERLFDVATGRSVSAIPQFCAWMHHLLEPQTGHLLYWIGGDVTDDLLNKTCSQTVIQDVLPPTTVTSDKRILVFPATAVSQIARESGIKVQRQSQQPLHKQRTNNKPRKPVGKKKSRGAWTRKNHRRDEPRDRGYSNFQRYSSTSWSAAETGSSSSSSSEDR